MITEKQYDEVKDVLSHNVDRVDAWKFDLTKVDATIRRLWQLLDDAGKILIVDGRVKPLRWYNFLLWWEMARMMYAFITDVIELWQGRSDT